MCSYLIASTRLNCIAFFKSGWRNVDRAFFRFCEAGTSFRRYLRAFWEDAAVRTCCCIVEDMVVVVRVERRRVEEAERLDRQAGQKREVAIVVEYG